MGSDNEGNSQMPTAKPAGLDKCSASTQGKTPNNPLHTPTATEGILSLFNCAPAAAAALVEMEATRPGVEALRDSARAPAGEDGQGPPSAGSGFTVGESGQLREAESRNNGSDSNVILDTFDSRYGHLEETEG